jgi:hypothetical protein
LLITLRKYRGHQQLTISQAETSSCIAMLHFFLMLHAELPLLTGLQLKFLPSESYLPPSRSLFRYNGGMLRRLRPVLLAMLMILAVALAILWTRSYFTYDLAGRAGSYYTALGSYRGHLLLFYWRDDSVAPSDARWGRTTGPVAEAESVWHEINKTASFSMLGFGFVHTDAAGLPILANVIFVPDWFAMILIGWPAFQLAAGLLRTRRRRRLGLCLQCGYNLQATPQRCPECGMEAGKMIG